MPGSTKEEPAAKYFFARRDLAVIDVVLGNHAEAIAGLESTGDRGSLGHALGVAGRSGEARQVLEALEQDARQQYVSPVQMALVHLGLGEHDEAMACLEQACNLRAVDLAFVRVDARFAPMAADGRFSALLERMNLPSRTDTGFHPRAHSTRADGSG
jgi:tetratricopeptide repeat protein